MAITLDTKGTAVFTGTGGSQSLASFTVGANTNPILLVMLWSTGGSSIATPAWNGSSLTSIMSASLSGPYTAAIFKHTSPSTGAHSLTATSTNGAGYGMMYAVYYGGSSALTDGTNGSGDSTTDPLTLTTTPASDSDVVVSFGLNGTVGASFTGTAAANNAQSSYCQGNASNVTSGFMGDSGVISPIGSVAATLTIGSAAHREIYAVVLKALTQTTAATLTMGNSASRTDSFTRAVQNTRTTSLTIMNAASRLATVVNNYIFTRTLASTALTFSAILKGAGGIWKTLTTDASSWATPNKSSTSWSTPNADTSSWTNQNKSTP